jgi:hypothetical protein
MRAVMTVTQDPEQGRAWLQEDPRLVQEPLRQNNVVAFSVAIPLLAAVLLVNRQEREQPPIPEDAEDPGDAEA